MNNRFGPLRDGSATSYSRPAPVSRPCLRICSRA